MLAGVEAVHFIDEQQGAQAMAAEPFLGLLHFRAQILDARQHGIEAAEVAAGGVGDDPRQGGFARAWRAMQDQAAEPISSDGSPQQAAWAEDGVLANELIKAARPQSLSERRLLLQLLIGVVAEQVHEPQVDGATLLRQARAGRLKGQWMVLCASPAG